jgi:hypothetical protein
VVTIVAAIANALRLRRLFGGESVDCFPGFEIIFDVPFVLVARFNFVKNSFVINVGSFNNGIYVPSSKIKKQTFFLFDY